MLLTVTYTLSTSCHWHHSLFVYHLSVLMPVGICCVNCSWHKYLFMSPTISFMIFQLMSLSVIANESWCHSVSTNVCATILQCQCQLASLCPVYVTVCYQCHNVTILQCQLVSLSIDWCEWQCHSHLDPHYIFVSSLISVGVSLFCKSWCQCVFMSLCVNVKLSVPGGVNTSQWQLVSVDISFYYQCQWQFVSICQLL